MDKEFLQMLLKLICFFPFIIFIIFIVLKYGGNKLQDLQNGRHIKIYEKVQISKENSLLVIKIGKKGYVISNTSKGVEILLPIDDDELEKMEYHKRINQYKDLNDFYKRFKKRKD